ncbi:helix-turn-helix domain-containing protein [Enterococcus hirae]|nr:helix-turn-helix domain-containing protein [Enterococcus hirae]EMF0572612.1 helix-turn-helix domain-containing protein [Enterococcus hirae]
MENEWTEQRYITKNVIGSNGNGQQSYGELGQDNHLVNESSPEEELVSHIINQGPPTIQELEAAYTLFSNLEPKEQRIGQIEEQGIKDVNMFDSGNKRVHPRSDENVGYPKRLKGANNHLFNERDTINDSQFPPQTTRESVNKPSPEEDLVRYVFELGPLTRQELELADTLFSNHETKEQRIAEERKGQTEGQEIETGNMFDLENNRMNSVVGQNSESSIDEEKHLQNPHSVHNDRDTSDFTQKNIQDKSTKNSESTPVNQNQETVLDKERHPKRATAHLSEGLHSIQHLESQTTKQTDKQLNPQTRHSLDLVLPQKANQSDTKNDYLEYIQLYQSIQSTIKIETFCDIMELSEDIFQGLLKEAVPDESTNSEIRYPRDKRIVFPKEYKLENVKLYLNSKHSYHSITYFCYKKNLPYMPFLNWLKEYTEGKLTRESISTIEELISSKQTDGYLDCTDKVKETCVLLRRGCSKTKTELCDKLNITDGVLRAWMDKYNQAHRNQQKNIITTLTELKERKLNSGKLCCTNEVKIKLVLLYKNREMSVKQLCKIYHLNPKTVYNWIKNYDRLLQNSERTSQERQTFSTNVGNAKITVAENNARLIHEQNKSPNLVLGNQRIQ